MGPVVLSNNFWAVRPWFQQTFHLKGRQRADLENNDNSFGAPRFNEVSELMFSRLRYQPVFLPDFSLNFVGDGTIIDPSFEV